MHPDTLLAQQVGDPITYAELKAAKLGLARAAAEKRAAAEAEEEMHKANALRSFQAMKQQVRGGEEGGGGGGVGSWGLGGLRGVKGGGGGYIVRLEPELPAPSAQG